VKCRHCSTDVSLLLIDLGSAPPSNAYLTKLTLRRPEEWFPLRVFVCEECWLVQTEPYPKAVELFNEDYAYFSSFSVTWLEHARDYVDKVIERFGIVPSSRVVEIGANDGYLLQFVKERGIPCLGVEPTASTAAAARAKGIPIIEDFFGVRLAGELIASGGKADLIVVNNVLAHVPDINDFVAGITALLKPNGIATFEFPHLMQLIAQTQFDTIYHEHFFYLSLTAVRRIFEHNDLVIFDVEELPTHGGSLRVYARWKNARKQRSRSRVEELMEREAASGMTTASYYKGFQEKANRVKDDLVVFLIEAKRSGKMVAGYGAAAKANTLLNFAGIRPDLLPYVVDKNPAKQGKFLPGSRIPIVSEDYLQRNRPDIVLILPWNIREEILDQLAYIRGWSGRFATAVPNLEFM
jgi:SAM-dependent methyltransferase